MQLPLPDFLLIFFFKVLDVLCSLCVCNGVAVRANQNLICDNLLPRRDLLLQTRLINDVTRYSDMFYCYIRKNETYMSSIIN